MINTNTLLQVENLKKHFPITKGFFKKTVGYVKAVDGINFYINKGETLGLVGESGCGKTTTGKVILRALDPTEGKIFFQRDDKTVDVAKLNKAQLKDIRKDLQMIFQDPYSSLNPRMTVLNIIGEPLVINNIAEGKALEDRVKELLDVVGLNVKYLRRYPHAFSGGQRQRIGIARALTLNPKLIVADEPVSALDVSIQAQVLNLMQELQQEFDLTYLFIAHDLSVVKHISDRVAVMYVGNIVETTDTESLYLNPKHPYTEALLSSVPVVDPRLATGHMTLPGEVADPGKPPSGCIFHPRCKYAKDVCQVEIPQLEEIEDSHWVSCHFAKELNLTGVKEDAS